MASGLQFPRSICNGALLCNHIHVLRTPRGLRPYGRDEVRRSGGVRPAGRLPYSLAFPYAWSEEDTLLPTVVAGEKHVGYQFLASSGNKRPAANYHWARDHDQPTL